MKAKVGLLLVAVILVIAACRTEVDRQVTPSQSSPGAPAPPTPIQQLPTLYPTATRLPTATPTQTRPAQPSATPEDPVDFQQPVVELRYQIPALGLDRTVLGNVSGHIQLADSLTGQELLLRDRAGILIEMQRSLPGITLTTAPEECSLCVLVAYELPLSGESDAGWITDAQMMASVENFTAVNLGPHMPSGTIVGLRRSATPFYPAHSIAITADGSLWQWSAVESRLAPAQPIAADAAVLAELFSLDPTELDDAYGADCPDGAGIESLYLSGDQEPRTIQVVCPSLAMPIELAGFYDELASLADAFIADQALRLPEPLFAVGAMLGYLRPDGSHLTVFADGRLEITGGEELTVTGNITPSLAVSLTKELLASGLLEAEPGELLKEGDGAWVAVRGNEGVLAVGWTEATPEGLDGILVRLDSLLERLLSLESTATPESENQAVPTSTAEP